MDKNAANNRLLDAENLNAPMVQLLKQMDYVQRKGLDIEYILAIEYIWFFLLWNTTMNK